MTTPNSGRHPYAVANLMLDLGDSNRLPISNLALQKLMYFAHGWRLGAAGLPLVRGGFQAWEHGPVNRVAYNAFKRSGDKPILHRARLMDLSSGQEMVPVEQFDADEVELLGHILSAFGHRHAYELLRVTHEAGSPWHRIWHSKSVVPGMQIPDDMIRAHFFDERFSARN